MAAKISQRVNEIFAEELKNTVAQLGQAKPRMDKLVTQLLEKN